MSKKLTSGEGWSLVPSEPGSADDFELLPPEKHRLKIKLEKRAKGKTVTSIGIFSLPEDDLKELAKKLKSACGGGGTARERAIEIQGDHRDRIRDWLQKNGWGVSG
jgi:translation initiation factor 1